MKRLILILSIFVIMIALSIGEIFFTTWLYNTAYEKLVVVETSMQQNADNLNNPETIAAIDDSVKFWQDFKGVGMIVSNHNTVKQTEEKLLSLQELIKLNEQSDAFVNIKLSLSFVHELINDNYPIISNIL